MSNHHYCTLINLNLCHLHHKLTGFYNRDEKCLLRGTSWLFKYSSLRFVFKGLKILRPIILYMTPLAVGFDSQMYKQTDFSHL